MRGILLAGRAAWLALGLLAIASIRPAMAVEVPLPGERTLELHSFQGPPRTGNAG